jgi:Flp pilus assembly pilin Flp
MNALLKGLAFVSAFVATAEDKKDEKGAAFTEYVVLLGLIVAAIVGAFVLLGPALTTAINDVIAQL